ncbi:MAG: DUF1822 family protein [Leptolyngbyaceae cyanobacterium SL_7_1]|nr:DUF1822 family protein [Leptolyngbyaceae cyanobacterium SL_7_1]
MINATHYSGLTIPITLKMHQLAQHFRQHHPHPQKAKQTYLNTLAVYSVHSYLNWLGIETDLPTSHSWDVTLQQLADVADLHVVGKGRLECRPVLPDQPLCVVPAEVWNGRIGFVAVQLDAALEEATLLGFVPTMTAEALPLEQLRSLDQLLNHLDQLGHAQPLKAATLRQWLENRVEMGWSTAETVLGWHQPALAFRGAEAADSSAFVVRGKLLHLTEADPAPLVLLVGVRSTTAMEVEVWVKLCPQDETLLPSALELCVLDGAGVAVMQAQARSTEMIQLVFSAAWDEQFSIRVTLDNATILQPFTV